MNTQNESYEENNFNAAELGETLISKLAENQGNHRSESNLEINSMRDLAISYTPAVAFAANKIADNTQLAETLTSIGTTVGIVTDGTAVLGLGDKGTLGARPIMEGKASLLKKFTNLNSTIISLDPQKVDDIFETIKSKVQIVYGVRKGMSAIMLEDIASPQCVAIEEALQEMVEIPVFHDDQHGTAMVVAAALKNSLKIVEKDISDCTAVINGAGAAGYAIAKQLEARGIKNIIVRDSKGVIYKDRENRDFVKRRIAKFTNKDQMAFPELGREDLSEAIKGVDIFIGVSQPNVLSKDMVKSMAPKPIVFALSNPDPEIHPDDAKEAGASVVATGNTIYPNQVNNALIFPGLFQGTVEGRAAKVDSNMRDAAIDKLAELTGDISAERIIPTALELDDIGGVEEIAKAVKEAVSDDNKRNINSEYKGSLDDLLNKVLY